MLEPRPEIRMATRRLGGRSAEITGSPKIEAAHIGDGRIAGGRDLAQPGDAFTGARELGGDRVGFRRLDPRGHAATGVVGAAHLSPGGSARGMLSGNPPPVIWASAFTAPVLRIAARHAAT